MKPFLKYIPASLILFLAGSLILYAQPVVDSEGDVSIGSPISDPSAILDLNSTGKGLLLPRMTEAERDAIPNPGVGLMIFNTTTGEMNYNFGTASSPNWQPLLTPAGSSLAQTVWLRQGNDIADDPSSVLGTISSHDLNIVAGNQTRVNIDNATGEVTVNNDFIVNGTATFPNQVQGDISGSSETFRGNLTGDVTSIGMSTTLTDVAPSPAGSYSNANITVDSKGRVVAASNGTVASGTVTGTGVGTQVAFWTPGSPSSAITSDPALNWDNTNKRLGVGPAFTPSVTLDVNGSGRFRGDNVTIDGNLVVQGTIDAFGRIRGHASGNRMGNGSNTEQLRVIGDGTGTANHLYVQGNGRFTRDITVDRIVNAREIESIGSEPLVLNRSGNKVGIGNYDASGNPVGTPASTDILDVNGNARFRGDQVVIDGNLVVMGNITANGRITGNSSGNQLGNSSNARQLTVRGQTGGSADHLFVIGNIRVTGEMRISEPDGSGYSAFTAQNQANSILYTLPATTGTAGQTLQIAAAPAPTASGATLQWATVAGAGGSATVSTANLNFPATAGQASTTVTTTVTGAADGDVVLVTAPAAVFTTLGAAGTGTTNFGQFDAWVSAANTVTVRFYNDNAAFGGPPPLDPDGAGGATYTIVLIQ